MLAQGDTIEAATESAVAEASKTVEGITEVYIDDIEAKVENNKVTQYRINAKITFVVGN